MRRPRPLGLATLTGLALLVPALAAPAEAAPVAHHPRGIAASTKANLLDAMRGEAKARASYLAYAAQARREGRRTVAKLFTDTAGVELYDHFVLEAGYVGLVGSNEANLKDAIEGEDYETTTMYPAFEATAKAQGDTKAAALFHEIADDEAAHRDLFKQALDALHGKGTTPAPPALDAVTVTAGPARSSGKTLTNLKTAMGGESFASAKYLAYAKHAQTTGQPALAKLFIALSNVELKEHFNAEADLAGLVGGSRANLATAAAGENYEATTMYPGFAVKAKAEGDSDVASTLTEIAGDEAAHRDAFRKARRTIRR